MSSSPTGTNPLDAHKTKIRDGRMMQGICMQWIIDNYRTIDSESLRMYALIARLTFGFRKQYAYIKQSEFDMNKTTLKKYRDKLTETGLIEWKITEGYTMYKIIEPKAEIENFDTGKATASNIKHSAETAASGSNSLQTYNPNEDI